MLGILPTSCQTDLTSATQELERQDNPRLYMGWPIRVRHFAAIGQSPPAMPGFTGPIGRADPDIFKDNSTLADSTGIVQVIKSDAK